MKVETIERMKAQLAELSRGASEMQDVYWLRSDGVDTDENYCGECANIVAAWYNGGDKPENADAMSIPDYSDCDAPFEVGGYANYYIEDDEPRWCDLCGVELAVSIVTGDGELDHWQCFAPESPESWRILARLLDIYEMYLLERVPLGFESEFSLIMNRKRAAQLLLILRRLLFGELALADCELDDACERPHENCGPGCDGYGN